MGVTTTSSARIVQNIFVRCTRSPMCPLFCTAMEGNPGHLNHKPLRKEAVCNDYQKTISEK